MKVPKILYKVYFFVINISLLAAVLLSILFEPKRNVRRIKQDFIDGNFDSKN